MTAIGCEQRALHGASCALVDQAGLRRLRGLREQRVEIDQRQQEVRKTALDDQGPKSSRARYGNSTFGQKLPTRRLRSSGDAPAMENTPACLTSTRYKRRIALLGLERDGEQHLAHVGTEFIGRRIHVELKFRLPGLIVRQPRSVRRLVRAVLQIHALQRHLHATDVEDRRFGSDLVHQAP